MTVFETIQKRYSCRAYQEKKIEKEKLAQLLEAARLAPSAKNLQDWRFIVVTDEDTKARVAEQTNRPAAFGKAPVIIVACSNSDYVMSSGQAVAPIDVAIALEHICLTATELGLATCWLGAFNTENVRRILGIPADINIVEMLAVGYPAEPGKPNNREPLEKIVCYNKWQF